MSVLAADRIRELLPDIFIHGTYDEECVGEASYNLRLSNTLLYIDQKWHGEDEPVLDSIKIKRGDIAYISTVELFKMPDDLVGLIELKFKMAIRGLVHLSGSRVDPGYGKRISGKPGKEGQKLFLLVMNMGPDDVEIKVNSPMFIVEFHELKGTAQFKDRQDNHEFVQNWIRQKAERKAYGFFLPAFTNQVNELDKQITKYKTIQNMLVWGIGILLIVTIFGVVVSFILSYNMNIHSDQKSNTIESQRLQDPSISKWDLREAISSNDTLYVLFDAAITPGIGDYLQILKETKNETGSVSEVVGIARVVGSVNGTTRAVVLDKTEECREGFFLVKK